MYQGEATTITTNMSSTEPEQKLSNRGNKLTGEENPGSIRPKMMWNKSREMNSSVENQDENMDFEVMAVGIVHEFEFIPLEL